MTTLLEKSALIIIATSENNQNNGCPPRTVKESATWIFIDEISEDLNLSTDKAIKVLSNLVKNGLIIMDLDENETLVKITQKGINTIWD